MFHPSPGNAPERQADVAQLVAHHLAKVRVAGSNPVVRSERPPQVTCGVCSVEWPRGEATACKAVYTGSNPVSTSARVRGRLAQRERASLTRKRSLVRSQYRPPGKRSCLIDGHDLFWLLSVYLSGYPSTPIL